MPTKQAEQPQRTVPKRPDPVAELEKRVEALEAKGSPNGDQYFWLKAIVKELVRARKGMRIPKEPA